MQQELDPANESGDREGSRWQDGVVTVPDPSFPPTAVLAKGGGVRAVKDPEFGGLGMPAIAVVRAANEFFDGANLGLAVSLLLTRRRRRVYQASSWHDAEPAVCSARGSTRAVDRARCV